jgi:hypothetical protein
MPTKPESDTSELEAARAEQAAGEAQGETTLDAAGNPVPVTSRCDITVYDVFVERSAQEKILVEGIPEWEIEVLRGVHGTDRVTTVDDVGYTIELLNPDPKAEYARLERKYARKGVEMVVQQALPMRDRQIAEVMGVTVKATGKAKAQPASVNVDRRVKGGSRAGA